MTGCRKHVPTVGVPPEEQQACGDCKYRCRVCDGYDPAIRRWVDDVKPLCTCGRPQTAMMLFWRRP